MTNSELLEKAARMIDKHGWAKYRFLDHKGAMSIDYAIWQVARDGRHRLQLDQIVKAAVKFPLGPHWDKQRNRVVELREGCLMRWNDDPRRTRYDVIRALTDASRLAAKLEAEEALT